MGILVEYKIYILGIVIRSFYRLCQVICSGREIECTAVSVLDETVEFFAYFAAIVADSVFGHDNIAIVGWRLPVRHISLRTGRKCGKKS